MRLMRLLQISDTAFPIGGYAYSNGLEAMYKLGYVGSERDVREFVQVQIEETLGRCDLPILFQSHAAAARHDLDVLVDIDLLGHALKTIPVYRDASQRMGRRLLEVVNATFADLHAATLFNQLAKEGKAHGHQAVAFGTATSDLGVSARDAAAAFAQAAIQAYVGAAVRLSVIGQSAAQQIASSLHPVADAVISQAAMMSPSEMGGYSPVIDFAGLVHAGLHGRQFSS
jgi:urease accessory protein